MQHHRTAFPAALAMVVALFVAIPAHAAKGDLIDIVWSADGSFGREVRVGAAQFAEVCGRLPAGAAVDWRFEAGAPMDFNVHFHEGQTVRYSARGESATQ